MSPAAAWFKDIISFEKSKQKKFALMAKPALAVANGTLSRLAHPLASWEVFPHTASILKPARRRWPTAMSVPGPGEKIKYQIHVLSHGQLFRSAGDLELKWEQDLSRFPFVTSHIFTHLFQTHRCQEAPCPLDYCQLPFFLGAEFWVTWLHWIRHQSALERPATIEQEMLRLTI